MMALPRELWGDLLGIPFRPRGRDPEEGLDCLGLVKVLYGRMGIPVPDPAGGWEAWEAGDGDPIGAGIRELGWVEVPLANVQAGDAVLLSLQGDAADHVGVMTDRDHYLHADESARAVIRTRIGAAVRLGVLLGVHRPPGLRPPERATAGLEAPWPAGGPGDGEILVLACRDPLQRPYAREVIRLPCPPGTHVRDLIPVRWRREGLADRVLAVDGSRRYGPDDEAPAGGRIALLALPQGGPMTLGTALLLSLGLSALSFAVSLLLAPELRKPRDEDDPGSPTFRLSGVRNTAAPGLAVPVVYGQHLVGGNIIQVFLEADEDGRQILNMLIALSAGPVQDVSGIATEQNDVIGPAIPETIRLNGTPARDYAGDVKVSVRQGLQNQTPIPGFSDVVQAVPMDFVLRRPVDGGEVMHHETEGKVDAFSLVVHYPLGLFNVTSSGNVNGRWAVHKVRWRVKGTTTWTEISWAVWNARRAPFSRSFRKEDLPLERYEIELERFSPPWPESATDKESKSVLITINEVTYDSLAYPGIALLALRAASAEDLNGTPPTVTCVIKGKRVWIPSGTPPTSGTITWNQDAQVWTDNPAWVLLDMLLDPIYGLNRNGGLTIDNIDLPAFKDWADLCDTLVSDGRGGAVPRARADVVFDAVQNGWEACVAFARSHWAHLLPVGDKLTVVLEQVRSPVALLGMGSVSDFSLRYEALNLRPNVVEVQYPNEETDYEADVAQKVDPSVFQGAAVVKDSLQLVGVTRPAQAYRMAQFRLNWGQRVNRTVELRCGIEAIHLLPGDVVEVAHRSIQIGVSGLCGGGTATPGILLDEDVTVQDGYVVAVRTSGTGTDTLQERTVSGYPTPTLVPAGTEITVDLAWDAGDTPADGDPYSIGPSGFQTQDFQVVAIETEADGTRRITAVSYDDSVYDDDPGTIETFTEGVPDDRRLPAPVSNVSVQEATARAPDGTVQAAVDVHFEKADQATAVDVWFVAYKGRGDVDGVEDESSVRSPTEEEWQYAGRTFGSRYRISGLQDGETLRVAVAPVSPTGTRTRPERAKATAIYTRGRTDPPTDPAVADIDVVAEWGNLILRTPLARADADVVGYPVYLAGRGEPPYRACALPVCEAPPGAQKIPFFLRGTNNRVLVAARNRSGVESLGSVGVVISALSPPRSWGQAATQDEAGLSWPGSLNNVLNVSGVIELDVATALSGNYETNGISLGTDRATPVILANPYLRLRADDLTWETSGFSWDDPVYADMTWSSARMRGFENRDIHSWADVSGLAWDSPVVETVRWSGPADLIGGMEPSIDLDVKVSGAWQGWRRLIPGTRPIEGGKVQEFAVRVNLQTFHASWVPQMTGLFSDAYIEDATEMEVADPNGDWPHPTSGFPTTVGSVVEELGFVKREHVKSWPYVPADPRGWHGTNYGIVSGSSGWQLILRDGMFDSAYITVRVPEWFQDLDGSNRIRWRITWLGSLASAGGSAWSLAVSHNASWDATASPVTPAAPGLLPGQPISVTIPAGYAANQIYEQQVTIPVSGTPTIQQPNGRHFVELLILRWTGDAYTGDIGIETIEIVSGQKRT